MTKLEMLFIRACKSRNPDVRLNSIIRRFYMTGTKDNQKLLISVLCSIADNYFPVSIHKIYNDMLTNIFFRDTTTMEYKMYFAIKYHIRYLDRTKLINGGLC